MQKNTLLLFIILALTAGQNLEIFNLNENPLSVTSVGQARLQIGQIKIIHPINLTKIEEAVELLLEIAKPEIGLETLFSYTLELKIDELKRIFKSLKPKPLRNRRWDYIGKVWKWIAGSPDADDLRALNMSINDLIYRNNEQIKINNGLNNKVEQIIDTVNSMLILHQSNLNKIQLEFSIINMIIAIDSLKKNIEDIQEAIIKARVNLIHESLVTDDEQFFIIKELLNEGIQLNIQAEALKYMDAKVVTNDETLLYIISIPKLSKTFYDVVRIIPLIKRNEKIKTFGEFYMISETETLLIRNKKIESIFKFMDVKNLTLDACIHKIIKGQHGNCQTQYVHDHDRLIQVNPTMILINYANVTFENSCGASNRSYFGNYLIKFKNCSITIDGNHFSNKEITFEETPLFLPIQNLAINTSKIFQEFNLTKLSELHLETRQNIEQLTLQHESTRLTLIIGFGGTTITMVILVILLVCYCTRY